MAISGIGALESPALIDHFSTILQEDLMERVDCLSSPSQCPYGQQQAKLKGPVHLLRPNVHGQFQEMCAQMCHNTVRDVNIA